MRRLCPLFLPAVLVAACSSEPEVIGPPPCGSNEGKVHGLIPGPEDSGFDAQLARLAHQYDRQFHALNAVATGLNSDIYVPLAAIKDRASIETFLKDHQGFDFSITGTAATEVIGHWQKSAGAYSGAAVAADAFRYGVLRDRGDACSDVEVARAQLIRGLENMHRSVEITGAHGVIARSLVFTGLPYAGTGEITPLFDEQGRPLPLEKNNGQWRADFSGKNADYIWEDSCSRDMMIGWALGFASAWEVIAADETIPESLKNQLKQDALAIGEELRKTRERGHDLEIIDADGRTTFHGYINEYALERFYLDTPSNGFYAAMALGTVASMAYVSGDAGLRTYLIDELARRRDLDGIAARDMLIVNLGEVANFSNYNMGFTAVWLALRYIDDAESEGNLQHALRYQLYSGENAERQPLEQAQSYYDLIYAAGLAGSTAAHLPNAAVDEAAVSRGADTLKQFPEPPHWDLGITNCDEAEIASEQCTLEDGTTVRLLGNSGRNGALIADRPVPMRVRPRSNYHWRSNPYLVNGDGDGSRLLPGADFRVAYWMGRWIRRQ